MKVGTTKILLTGGGSGGHIYPLLAVVEALKKAASQRKEYLEIFYLGPDDNYSGLLKNAGIKTKSIPAGKIRRYLSPLTILDIPKIFFGIFVALWKVYWIMPDAIFSKGGTGALPVVIAGWFYRIPIIIHESDAAPGLNNLLSAWFASRIAVSFEAALKYFNPKKSAWVGTPIRVELIKNRPSRETAKENFGFDAQEPLILILGGSLGSDRINKFVVSNLAGLIKETQVMHQTGQANYSEIEKLSRAALIDLAVDTATKTRYKAVPYFKDDLKIALSAADIVVSRAGSGTIFEIAAFEKPAILIPLHGSANDHQRKNAYEFARGGGAIVIEEENLLPAIFIAQIRSILKNEEAMNKMALASSKFFKPQATETIAQELLNLSD